MEITLKKNYCYELIFEADNVRVVEDIESREYPKDENGKTIFNFSPKRDIKTDVLEKMTEVLDDMIYYREAEFDSSNLIEKLFKKLPLDLAITLIKKLERDYVG